MVDGIPESVALRLPVVGVATDISDLTFIAVGFLTLRLAATGAETSTSGAILVAVGFFTPRLPVAGSVTGCGGSTSTLLRSCSGSLETQERQRVSSRP
jgi:hypothetical protein